MIYDTTTGVYIFCCPHCESFVQVERNQLNCRIFRHAFFYNKIGETITLTNQLNPHAPKEECDRLFNEGKIIGCGKPFKLVGDETQVRVEICDYI